MVVIRLSRTGRKRVAMYRIVVMDSRVRRDSRCIEKLGEYNPTTQPATFRVDHERALYWLNKGAQMSDTVHSLFHRDGVVKKFQLSKKGLDATNIEIERKDEKAPKEALSKKAAAKAKTIAEEKAKPAEPEEAKA